VDEQDEESVLTQPPIISESDEEMDEKCYYSIKLINPDRKSDYSVEKWHVRTVFKTVSHLTTTLREKYAELEPCKELRIGYMDPGHGWKGKQRWITCDDDLKDMYKAYGSKIEIMIWCFLPSKTENGAKKRKSPSDKSDTAEKRTRCVAAIEDKMNEVKDILAKLQSKHGNKYSVEQYHAWAQLIQIGKQESYDKPPNFPFFVGRKQDGNKSSAHIHGSETSTRAATSTSAAGSTASTNTTSISVISPGKRINLRTECIQQLQQLGELLEKGNITHDQYEKLQSTILNDIYKF